MPLSAGTKLGPYEILAPIGAGGMGEVYKARDTRLDRIVAIKVSKTEFSERFEREAQAIAALNHPNICQLYDVGPNYLVMEYIEGTPLKGPLPLDQALKYAAQICDALDAAHKKGITHRDLKPANILVTKAGVKLLDFGLAKMRSAGLAAKPPGDATLTMALTGKNEIVGTLYYMSPEQLQAQGTGQEIDARSDIFSFGVVLYEMLTGKRAFEGSSPASVIAAIMERPAPSVGDVATAALERVLKTSLAKNPDDRWQSARDLKRSLEWVASASAEAVVAAPPSRSRFGAVVGWTVAAAAVALLGALLYRTTRPVEHPLMRFTDDLGTEISLTGLDGPAVAISPEGSRLAYLSLGTDQKTHLSVRLLGNPKSTVLAGTEDAQAPFFSQDGRWIGFFTGNTLKKISVDGGAAVALCELGRNPRGGGFWGEDGNIYFAGLRTPIMRVPASGGEPFAITDLDKQKGEISHRGVQLLPGGETFLFGASNDNNVWEDATIQIQSVKTGQRKTLVRGGYFGHYIHGSDPSEGHLIYMHGGTLFAAPMDVKSLELTGPASPVLQDVASRRESGVAQLGFTASGTLVYVAGSNINPQESLFWVDAAGNAQVLPAASGEYTAPRVSPDGTRIAVIVSDGSGRNLAVYEWAQNRMTRLTFKGAVTSPAWTPDGKHFVCALASAESSGIYWIRSDGASEPQRLIEGQNLTPRSFSPDGKLLAYSRGAPDFGIWTVALDLADPDRPKAGKPELFLASKTALQLPILSPDGRWIAYSSSESGQPEIFVRPFPRPGGKWQVSTSGGIFPIWSRNGQELLYVNGTQMMVVPYSVRGDSFSVGQPRHWSEKAFPAGPTFDLSSDGKRFAVVMPAATATPTERPTHVTFLLSFADELQRKVPTEK